MKQSDEELLRCELNYAVAADYARQHHRRPPGMPPGHRFILWVMLLIWLLLGAATTAAWGSTQDLSGVAVLVEPNLKLSKRACTAADFGLPRASALPFKDDRYLSAAANAPFPKSVPLFRSI